jgi:hypothetical protein
VYFNLSGKIPDVNGELHIKVNGLFFTFTQFKISLEILPVPG